MNKKFATALNCIDGRTQIPVINWMRAHFNVNYVDLITEPGMDKVLLKGDPFLFQRIKDNTYLSIAAHDSNVVAVVGHYNCAANPVSNQQHFNDIAASVNVVRSWGFPVRVVGLWVDEFWHVHFVRE